MSNAWKIEDAEIIKQGLEGSGWLLRMKCEGGIWFNCGLYFSKDIAMAEMRKICARNKLAA